MLVVSGEIRHDSGRGYQLHDFDQVALARQGSPKGAFLVDNHCSGGTHDLRGGTPRLREPGRCSSRISGDVQMFTGEVRFADHEGQDSPPSLIARIDDAVALLRRAAHPGIYLGWGARDASAERSRSQDCWLLGGDDDAGS